MVGRHSRSIKATLLSRQCALLSPKSLYSSEFDPPYISGTIGFQPVDHSIRQARSLSYRIAISDHNVGWVKPTTPRRRFPPQEQSTHRTKIAFRELLAQTHHRDANATCLLKKRQRDGGSAFA